jgi:hypothetical protein
MSAYSAYSQRPSVRHLRTQLLWTLSWTLRKNFLTDWTAGNFSRISLLHGVVLSIRRYRCHKDRAMVSTCATCSGVHRFKYRAGYRITWFRVSVVFFGSCRQKPWHNRNCAVTASFHFLFDSFTNSIVQRHILWIIRGVFKPRIDKWKLIK